MSMSADYLTRRKLLDAMLIAGAGLLSPNFSSASASDKQMVARIFFESFCADALRDAQRYAGQDGYVASIPQLLRARCSADYSNIIWNTWFFSVSEEMVLLTPAGNSVAVIVHGNGFLADPDRIEQAVRANLNRENEHGLTGQYAVKITMSEAHRLLRGITLNGEELPLYSYQEHLDLEGRLPRNYGVVLDYDLASKCDTGFVEFDDLREQPLMIARAGGIAMADAYLQKFQNRNDTTRMLFSHRLRNIDPAEPQSRLLSLGGNIGGTGSEGHDGLDWGYGEDWGLAAASPVDMGRYVAVAPRNMAQSLQYLEFES